MSILVFISPSSQPWNKCQAGDSEQDHCRAIGSALYNLMLKDDRFKVGICPILEGDENERLGSAVWYSDKFINENGGNVEGVPCYHLAIHSDAFNGSASGFSSFFTGTGKGKKLAECLYNSFGQISPWSGRALKDYSALYEIRKPIASSCLFECNFHDNLQQAQWIHNNIDNIAMAFYKGFCAAENISPKDFTPPPPPAAPPPIVEDVDKKWKQAEIQKCIDNGLLEDKNWINKYNDSIPVFAICKMINKLIDKSNKDIEQYKSSIADIAKIAVNAEITKNADKLYNAVLTNVLSKLDTIYKTETIEILKKK